MINKKRKLEEIRLSNNIVKGMAVYSTFKISNELLKNQSETNQILAKEKYKFISKRLNKKFNNKLIPVDLQFGLNGDDFIKNTMSVIIKFNHFYK